MPQSNDLVVFFDSGVGGLTAVFKFLKYLPYEQILYFADTAYMPYGEKTFKEILDRLGLFFNFIKRFSPKLVVIACGTASSVLNKEGTKLSSFAHYVPVIDVIEPSCKKIFKSTKNNNVGIIATTATTRSNVYGRALCSLNPSLKVFSKPCHKLASFIEKSYEPNFKNNLNSMLKEYLGDFKTKNIDVLLLGCTHYSIIKESISAYVGNKIKIVDASKETAKCAVDFLKEKNLLNTEQTKKNIRAYVTGEPTLFLNSVKTLFGSNKADAINVKKTSTFVS